MITVLEFNRSRFSSVSWTKLLEIIVFQTTVMEAALDLGVAEEDLKNRVWSRL